MQRSERTNMWQEKKKDRKKELDDGGAQWFKEIRRRQQVRSDVAIELDGWRDKEARGVRCV